MRPFWKCLIVSKTLVRTKLKFYTSWENWNLISIFSGPIYFGNVLLTYCHKNFGKNKIEILPFLGELGPNFHIFWAHLFLEMSY